MSWLVLALAAPAIGFLVGRWWAAAVVPALFLAFVVAASIADNYDDPCTRDDGCGIGPVLQSTLLGLISAALLAGLIALGVMLRRRRGPARPPSARRPAE